MEPTTLAAQPKLVQAPASYKVDIYFFLPSRQWFLTSLKSTIDTVVRLSPNMNNQLSYYYYIFSCIYI
jgi:hypothetical protein